jgi:HSP20 family molecular chaperone IbpA
LVKKDNHYELNLNVRGYGSGDLSVNLKDNEMTVSGQWDEKFEDGHLEHHEFSRSYELPEEVDAKGIKALLIDSKTLRVEAPVLGSPQNLGRYDPGRVASVLVTYKDGKKVEVEG